MINRPAALGSFLGAAAASALCVMLVSSASCVACSSEPPSSAADAAASTDADIATTDAADSGPTDVADASDAPPNGDGWFDGEYCPSAQYPPRTDGCPCRGPGDLTSPYNCTEATIGKECDYYQGCPPGPALRYRCGWFTKPDGSKRVQWLDAIGVPCPRNDAG